MIVLKVSLEYDNRNTSRNAFKLGPKFERIFAILAAQRAQKASLFLETISFV